MFVSDVYLLCRSDSVYALMCVCMGVGACAHTRVCHLSGIQILPCTQWLYHLEGGRLTLLKMGILPELIFQVPCKGSVLLSMNRKNPSLGGDIFV